MRKSMAVSWCPMALTAGASRPRYVQTVDFTAKYARGAKSKDFGGITLRTQLTIGDTAGGLRPALTNTTLRFPKGAVVNAKLLQALQSQKRSTPRAEGMPEGLADRIRQGQADARPIVNDPVNAKITLFNGLPRNGNPTIIIYAFPDLSSPLTIVGEFKRRRQALRIRARRGRSRDPDAAGAAERRRLDLRRHDVRQEGQAQRAHHPLHRGTVLCNGTFFLLDGASATRTASRTPSTSASRSAAGRVAGSVSRPGGLPGVVPATGHARRGHLRHPQQPAGPEAVLADIEQRRPERSGAWATSSVTARCRTSARLLRNARTSAWAETTTSWLGELDIATSPAAQRPPPAGRWRCSAAARGFLAPSTAREGERCRPLPRQSARPGLGVRALDRAGPRLPELQPQRICLIGHSHIACHFSHDGGETESCARRHRARAGAWRVARQCGQRRSAPRRRSRAAYAAGHRRMEGRVPARRYAVEEAAEAILRAGLPPDLAHGSTGATRGWDRGSALS